MEARGTTGSELREALVSDMDEYLKFEEREGKHRSDPNAAAAKRNALNARRAKNARAKQSRKRNRG